MPRYQTTKRKKAAKARKKAIGSYSRDKRVLKRWAVHGSKKDYEKLRSTATKFAETAPDYVLPEAVDELATVDRRRMLQLIHEEPHDVLLTVLGRAVQQSLLIPRR